MARVQTRRTVSMSAGHLEMLRKISVEKDTPMSTIVEWFIDRVIDGTIDPWKEEKRGENV